jgi:two-component system, response regulator YesN
MWKIAIIDDDRQVLNGLRSQINWNELQAKCVGERLDGEQGLELIRSRKPDLVITDIYMPEMNGLEMIQALRQEQFEGKIIIHSGYNDFEYARQALRMNVQDYLSKPISVQTLHTTLTRALLEIGEEHRKKREQDEVANAARGWLQGEVTCGMSPALMIEFFQQLTEAVLSNQKEKALRIIRIWMKQLHEHKDELQNAGLRNLGVEIMSSLSFALYESGILLSELLPSSLSKGDLNAITTPRQLQEWTEQVIEVICSKRQASENLKHKQTIDYLIQYVHKHYSEEISLSDMAGQVYISRNYLSDLFKQSTGETFHNYLTRIRMEQAKKLIIEGKWRIYEIAQKVGYKNVPYFSSAFKKFYDGINPSELVK